MFRCVIIPIVKKKKDLSLNCDNLKAKKNNGTYITWLVA